MGRAPTNLAHSSALAALTATAVILAAPLAGAHEPESGNAAPHYEEIYYYDQLGRRMRAAFDPGNRFVIGTGWEGVFDANSGQGTRQAAYLHTGIFLRDGCDGTNEDCWKASYDFLETRWLTDNQGVQGWPAGRTQLFSGGYLRYLQSPYVTVPTSPPRKLFVPFNFGVSVDVGRLEIPALPHQLGWDVGIIDTRLLLDFWRTPSPGSSLRLGVGIKYDIHVTDADPHPEVEHILSPFTATSLEFRHESKNGLHRLGAGVDAGPSWSDRAGWAMHCEASATYELTILALNDRPISLYSAASYRYHERAFASTLPGEEFIATAGLAYSLPLD